MLKKYRIVGGMGYPVNFNMDKSPIPGLAKHLDLPKNVTSDIIAFTSKYVESFANLNRAYFANEELVKAYNTIPFKAVDIEHDVEDVVGHIHSHVYVDRAKNQVVSYEELTSMHPDELAKTQLDVVVGAVVYVDRFPKIESQVSRKAWAISIESYFSDFDILLQNGLRLSQDEAAALGMSDFVDQLMGNFDSAEDFDKSHSIMITTADNKKQKVMVFKYLKDIMFSGAGLVGSPACPSCTMLSVSGEEEPDKATASSQIFSLDLRKVDSYMRAVRDGRGIGPITFQVREDIKCGCPDNDPENAPEQAADSFTPSAPPNLNPPTGSPRTPGDYTNLPTACPQYQLDANMWCLFANKQCVTAGDRSFKDCHRWLKDPSGRWLFDTRNTTETEEEIVISDIMGSEAEDVEVEQAGCNCKASLNYTLQAAEYALEAWEAKKDTGAVWTPKAIGSFPNSSFAVVETGYKEGMNKDARQLPFKDSNGEVNIAYLRKAIAKASKIKSVLGNDTDAELRKRALAKLEPYAKRFLNQDQEGGA